MTASADSPCTHVAGAPCKTPYWTLNSATPGRPRYGEPLHTLSVTMTYSDLLFVLQCGVAEFCANLSHELSAPGVCSGYDLNVVLGGHSVGHLGVFSCMMLCIKNVSQLPWLAMLRRGVTWRRTQHFQRCSAGIRSGAWHGKEGGKPECRCV